MTDINILNTTIFQTIARLRSGTTHEEGDVFEAAWRSAFECSPVGTPNEENYAIALNTVQAIKEDWTAYITVEVA